MSTLIGKQGRRFRDLVINRRAVSASTTALNTDYMIAVTDTTAARTVSLPAVATIPSGKSFVIKDESGAAGTNAITIDPSGSETIHGAATALVNTNWGSMTLVSNGTSWLII